MDIDMSQPLVFPCEGIFLAGTLHPADGRTAVLMVSGGRQTRHGSHRGFVALAEGLARAGYPVLRFDRRGVGDSDGDDPGFRASGPDIAAARAALRATCPHVRSIIGWGLCDGATALVLHSAGFDGLILANPWTQDAEVGDPLPQPSAIKANYAEKLVSPAAWRRLLSGAVNLKGLVSGLAKLLQPQRITRTGAAVLGGLRSYPGKALVLLADRDGTAQAFAAMLRSSPRSRLQPDFEVETIAGATHTFPGELAETRMIAACTGWLCRLDTQPVAEAD
jgi:exosortase A-associated hydrolase 1